MPSSRSTFAELGLSAMAAIAATPSTPVMPVTSPSSGMVGSGLGVRVARGGVDGPDDAVVVALVGRSEDALCGWSFAEAVAVPTSPIARSASTLKLPLLGPMPSSISSLSSTTKLDSEASSERRGLSGWRDDGAGASTASTTRGGGASLLLPPPCLSFNVGLSTMPRPAIFDGLGSPPVSSCSSP